MGSRLVCGKTPKCFGFASRFGTWAAAAAAPSRRPPPPRRPTPHAQRRRPPHTPSSGRVAVASGGPPCLPRAGAGQDEGVFVRQHHGRLLFGVQALDERAFVIDFWEHGAL